MLLKPNSLFISFTNCSKYGKSVSIYEHITPSMCLCILYLSIAGLTLALNDTRPIDLTLSKSKQIYENEMEI